MAIFRTEHADVQYAIESTWGERSSGTWRRFGLHEQVTVPDPTQAWYPFYGAGAGRNRLTILRGRWEFKGSIPNIKVVPELSGNLLSLPIGHLSGDQIIEGLTIHDEEVQSFSLQVAMRDTNGTYSLIREYYGGKVNRATLSAHEGEEVQVSLDDVSFKDIAHNLVGVNKYSSSVGYSAPTNPSANRFMFAGGTLQFFGQKIARISSMSLSIDNNIQTKYYVNASGDPTNYSQVPNALIEGRRVYQMQVQFDLGDPSTDLLLFKYLMNESAASAGGASTGGQIVMSFALATGSGSGEMIITTSPNGATSAAPGTVVTSGNISIPSPENGLFPSTWNFSIDSLSITVPGSQI